MSHDNSTPEGAFLVDAVHPEIGAGIAGAIGLPAGRYPVRPDKFPIEAAQIPG